MGNSHEDLEQLDFSTLPPGQTGKPEFPGPEPDGAFMMSEELQKIWEDVQRLGPEEYVEKLETNPAEEDQRPVTADDFHLLLESIKLYFEAAPMEDEELDGMSEEDREALALLGEFLQDELEGPEVRTVNTAPPGRLPWEIIDVDEESGVVDWGVDLTEGRAVDPWRNAMLSREAKDKMWELHQEDPAKFDVDALAQLFRVRKQRVMAILALQQMKQDAVERGVKPLDHIQELMEEEVFHCDEAVGSGERHYTILPSYPNYKEMDNRTILNRLEAKLGRRVDQISEEDLTPELARDVLGLVSQQEVEAELAVREEASLVEQFKRSLEYNMGKVGKGIKRASRKSHAPRRPRNGWSLVVRPLGESKDPHEQAQQAYVAKPDGSRRALTDDEMLYLRRAAAIPRRKII